MNILLICNDPPYGTERSYNGLRLAKALAGLCCKPSTFCLARSTQNDHTKGTNTTQTAPTNKVRGTPMPTKSVNR